AVAQLLPGVAIPRTDALRTRLGTKSHHLEQPAVIHPKPHPVGVDGRTLGRGASLPPPRLKHLAPLIDLLAGGASDDQLGEPRPWKPLHRPWGEEAALG